MLKAIDSKFKYFFLEVTTTTRSIKFCKSTLQLFMAALVSIAVHAAEIKVSCRP